jgi:SAM-dependent methyltransferase
MNTKRATLFKSQYPGENLLDPKIYHSGYLFTRSLLDALQSAINTNLTGSNYRIIDVACGTKPYYPLFMDIASEYTGLDINNSEYVDIIASAEDIPSDDNYDDIAVSTQALEHIKNYQAAIDEIHRVLKVNGHCFLSTHGVMEIHGAPHDYWRFTEYGLREIFKEFESVDIIKNGGAILCLFQVLNTYLRKLNNIPILNVMVKIVMLMNNIIGWNLDKLFFKYDFYTINYLVVAKK